MNIQINNTFDNITHIVKRDGVKISDDEYKLLNTTVVFSKGKAEIITTNLHAIKNFGRYRAKDVINTILGDKNMLYDLNDELHAHFIREEKRIRELIVSNNIEINGVVSEIKNGMYNNGICLGDIENVDKKYTLQNVLLNNIGRKAKITIEFED